MPSESDGDGEGNANASSTASSGCSPRVGAAAAAGSPPPFLTKTYDMVDDISSDPIVSWSNRGTSFVVWNPPELARDLLPQYFKHSNFSSFVRQLNTYGFRKVDPDRWEFANEEFIRGKKGLLRNISRKKPSPQQQQQQNAASCESKPGLEAEVDRLNRDKDVLMLELVRLRQQRQQAERELMAMDQRVQESEQRQKLMIAFLAKAIQSPGFLSQVLQRDGSHCSSAASHKKRNRREALEEESFHLKAAGSSSSELVRFDPVRRLSQFFDHPDLKTQEPSLELELLVRELLRQQQQRQQEADSGAKQQEDVTTSMERQLSPPSGVTEVSCQSGSVAARAADKRSFNLNSDPEESGAAGTPVFQADVRASVDNGAVGVGFNDVFWERFLTDSETGG